MKRSAMIVFLIAIFFLWNTPKASAQFSEAGVQKIDVPIDAPNFTLKVLGGGKISLEGLRGKIIVLNFFTSWCPICQEEFLSFDELYEEFKSKDILFLKVAVKAKEKDLGRYRKFSPILMDNNGKVASAYGVGHHATFFINREGKIVGKTFAEQDWTSESMRNFIQYLSNQ
jgi:peroxiredoxin